jgi:hypothetical protein
LVFEKNANFFAENWQKSQKIVIITSTPDRCEFVGKKSSKTYFWLKLSHNFYRGKRRYKILSASVFKKNCPMLTIAQYVEPWRRGLVHFRLPRWRLDLWVTISYPASERGGDHSPLDDKFHPWGASFATRGEVHTREARGEVKNGHQDGLHKQHFGLRKWSDDSFFFLFFLFFLCRRKLSKYWRQIVLLVSRLFYSQKIIALSRTGVDDGDVIVVTVQHDDARVTAVVVGVAQVDHVGAAQLGQRSVLGQML